MEAPLKQRLVGALVLVALAVIFVPMILDGSGQSGRVDLELEIPPPPVYPDPPVAVVPAPVPAPPPAEAPEPATESETAPVVEAAPAPDDPEPEAGPTVEPESESGPPPASPDEVIAWVVQVGSFGARENATGLAERLREAGFAAFVEPYRANGRALFRVKVGPTTAREDAEALQARLIGEQDLKQSIVVSHP